MTHMEKLALSVHILFKRTSVTTDMSKSAKIRGPAKATSNVVPGSGVGKRKSCKVRDVSASARDSESLPESELGCRRGCFVSSSSIDLSAWSLALVSHRLARAHIMRFLSVVGHSFSVQISVGSKANGRASAGFHYCDGSPDIIKSFLNQTDFTFSDRPLHNAAASIGSLMLLRLCRSSHPSTFVPCLQLPFQLFDLAWRSLKFANFIHPFWT